MSIEPTTLTLVGAPPQGVSAEEFKAVFRHHPAGVAVVTLRTPDGPVGFTATSVISVSADPPILAFSLAASSSSRPAVEGAESLVVNFLAAGQQDVAARFARRGVDRFATTTWATLPTGEPVLAGTTAWVRGLVEERVPVGDSMLVTVRAVRADRGGTDRPLTYVDRSYHRLDEHSRLG
ncbi:flavin reductase family protein [Georgenia yuyongxinii]|uniref:flavin reductase family protein n=1 Tax=Georgenia yuyongxinii TaxID=2589797 RepID=UPI001C8F3751|nr:flavin reductase family protein [Georgenia yuyongxinii]